jgi:serine/threonine-protein kinase HipA
VCTVIVSNIDDHLRNHGFIYERYKGWRLPPVYDINPTPIEIGPCILTTSIDFYNNSASLETAMSVTNNLRLTKSEAFQL